MTANPSLEGEASQWGQSLLWELQEQYRGNICESGYISQLDEEDADLRKIYKKQFQTLVGLKKKYDSENVYKHSRAYIVFILGQSVWLASS